MRIVLSLILAMPIMATAQECDSVCQVYRQHFGLPETNSQPAPSYGLPVQPVLPVPQDRGPWGTGYSVVTTTRPKTNLFDRDMVGAETVQRVVPNDGLGQPMRGLDLQGW
jgi:hypothetical protein